MGRTPALTYAQRDALFRLAEKPEKWAKPCRDVRTLERLRNLGLVELRLTGRPFYDFQARIGPAGAKLARELWPWKFA